MNKQELGSVLNNLKQFMEYDPEDWSIVPYNERALLENIVNRMAERDLSVGRVLVAANLAETPSKVQYTKKLIVKRYFSIE